MLRRPVRIGREHLAHSEPERLAARYDYGDGLHLSVAGHRALAAEVAAALGE